MKSKISRRDFLRLSALAAGAGVIAACAPALTSTPAPQATEASGAAAATAPTAAPAVTEATVYTPTASTAKSVTKVVFQTKWNSTDKWFNEKVIPAFEKDNPDIKVELLWKPDDPQGILTEIVGGTAPDVIQHYTSSADFYSLAPKGVFMELDDLIKGSKVIKQDDYVDAQWNGVTWNGHKYGLFAFEGGPWPAIGWNKKMFTAAGLDPSKAPQSLDELYSLSQQLTKVDGSGNVIQMGLDIQDAEGPEVRTASMMCDSPFISDDKTKILFSEGHWEDILALYAKLVNQVPPDKYKAYNTKWGTWTFSNNSAFCNSKEAMIIDGSWDPGGFKQYTPDKTYDLGWDFMPNINKKKYVLMAMHQLTIPKTSKVPEAAFRWMEWLMSNQDFNLMNFKDNGSFMWSKSLVKMYDVTGTPGLAWFLDAPNHADKTYGPGDFGSLVAGEVSKLYAQAQQAVAFGKKTPKQALDDLTATLQPDLDTAWQAIK